MIPIKKEPAEMYKETKVYEKCIFCKKETDTWHEKTNTPACKTCAPKYLLRDLKDLIK